MRERNDHAAQFALEKMRQQGAQKAQAFIWETGPGRDEG